MHEARKRIQSLFPQRGPIAVEAVGRRVWRSPVFETQTSVGGGFSVRVPRVETRRLAAGLEVSNVVETQLLWDVYMLRDRVSPCGVPYTCA